MTDKPVPCLHCAIVDTINQHLNDHQLHAVAGSVEATRLHAQISAHLMNTLEQHIEDDQVLSEALRREAWRSVVKWSLTKLMDHTSLQDIVDSLIAKAQSSATVKH